MDNNMPIKINNLDELKKYYSLNKLSLFPG